MPYRAGPGDPAVAPDDPAHAEADWSALALARFSQAFRGVLDDHLRPVGLTGAQYLALRLVDDRPGLTNAELARELLVTPQSTIRTVRSLTEAGLVARTPSPRHGRLLDTYLTPKGTRLLRRARPLAEAAEAAVLAPLTTAQQARLVEFLERCTAALGPS